VSADDQSERSFEAKVRQLINASIIAHRPDLLLMESKKAVDILICKEGLEPTLYFLEIKFHKKRHGRLGFGGRNGIGFQPEIMSRKPAFFSQNMRWVIGAERYGLNQFILLTCNELDQYVAGGKVDEKFNNIQARVLTNEPLLDENALVAALQEWLQ
jgi:hypothetical protein